MTGGAVETLDAKKAANVRILACFGGMVIVSGMERMSFEVLRVLKENGAAVHCIVNSWENHRIVALSDALGATWSVGRYRERLERRLRNPIRVARMSWDVLATSGGLLRDAARFRPTHLFFPEHVSLLRNAPALLVLRALGIPVVTRLANHPESGRFYERLWRLLLPCLTSVFVHISEFSYRRALDHGVPPRKMTLVRNRVPRRPGVRAKLDEPLTRWLTSRRTLLVVGQIAPFKGTLTAVEAGIALLNEGWDIQLAVVGRRPSWPPDYADYDQAIERRIAEAGCEERIRLLGEREDVPEILERGYLLLAPITQEETFGTALLEARLAGLPVVAFARGGIPEQVEHLRTGFLCDACTEEALLDGIRYFLENPGARDGASRASRLGFEGDDAPFSPRRFEREWLEVFTRT